jgi:hypothetical protein
MSVQSVKQAYYDQLKAASPIAGSVVTGIAKAVVNSAFPDDFEYYLCSLELVNGITGETEELLVFPVMPDSINISNSHISSITKTLAGTVVLENSTFVPLDIQIAGTFGRKFRMLVGRDKITGTSFLNATFPGVTVLSKALAGKTGEFDKNVKTGYGVTKILEKIYNKSTDILEDGTFYKMFFYNFAFNHHFLVQGMNLTVNQNRESNNMMWNYQLQMKAVAPADQVIDKKAYNKSLGRLLTYDVIQKGLNKTVDYVKDQKNILKNQLLSQNLI